MCYVPKWVHALLGNKPGIDQPRLGLLGGGVWCCKGEYYKPYQADLWILFFVQSVCAILQCHCSLLQYVCGPPGNTNIVNNLTWWWSSWGGCDIISVNINVLLPDHIWNLNLVTSLLNNRDGENGWGGVTLVPLWIMKPSVCAICIATIREKNGRIASGLFKQRQHL